MVEKIIKEKGPTEKDATEEKEKPVKKTIPKKPKGPRAKKEDVPKKEVIRELKAPKEEKEPEQKKGETQITVEKMKTSTIKIENTETKEFPKKYEGPAGQLAVDVYQTEAELVVQSAIAGVKAESLDISLEGDILTITGTREQPKEDCDRDYFYQECYWGPFTRQIMMSVEVDPSRTEASLKDGILTIRIPKIDKEKKRKITVRE